MTLPSHFRPLDCANYPSVSNATGGKITSSHNRAVLGRGRHGNLRDGPSGTMATREHGATHLPRLGGVEDRVRRAEEAEQDNTRRRLGFPAHTKKPE